MDSMSSKLDEALSELCSVSCIVAKVKNGKATNTALSSQQQLRALFLPRATIVIKMLKKQCQHTWGYSNPITLRQAPMSCMSTYTSAGRDPACVNTGSLVGYLSSTAVVL